MRERARGFHGLALVASGLALALALAPGVLAQDASNETASNVTPAEPVDESEAEAAPDAGPDLELPTERETIGETPGPGVDAEPNTVEDSAASAPEESLADSPWFTLLAALAMIALGFLALLGVAYAAYSRGGDRR